MNTKAKYFRLSANSNVILGGICCVCLLWIGFTESWMVAIRYAIYLSCLVTDGLFISAINSTAASKSRMIVASLMMVVANGCAIYLAFPNMLLVAAFWIPSLIGLAVGRLGPRGK
jgi:hypothetical protein